MIWSDVRDVAADCLRGLRRRAAPGRTVQRPARRPEPEGHLRHQPRRLGPLGPPRQGLPGSSGSCSPRRAATTAPRGTVTSDESAPFFPVTPYAESKVLVERDLHALADDGVQPHLSARRHGLRHVGEAARRPGRQQSHRLRGDDWPSSDQEQRHVMAAIGPCRGHRRRVSGRARGAARAGPRSGVQRRRHGRELPRDARSRSWSRRWCREPRSRSPAAPARTSAITGSIATS